MEKATEAISGVSGQVEAISTPHALNRLRKAVRLATGLWQAGEWLRAPEILEMTDQAARRGVSEDTQKWALTVLEILYDELGDKESMCDEWAESHPRRPAGV